MFNIFFSNNEIKLRVENNKKYEKGGARKPPPSDKPYTHAPFSRKNGIADSLYTLDLTNDLG